MSKTSAAVKNRYNEKNYDRISVVVPKGDKERITAQANLKGFASVSEYIRQLINKDSE